MRAKLKFFSTLTALAFSSLALVVVASTLFTSTGHATPAVIIQLGADIDGQSAGDWSGYSVAMSQNGTRVAIGATETDYGGANSGQVRVYDWNGSSWIQAGTAINGEASGDKSGWSIDLSSDGNRLAIGAPFNDGGGNANSGHVRVYDWDGTTWVQRGQDINGEYIDDWSGFTVAMSGDGNRVVIGSYTNDGSTNTLANINDNRGHVRVYQLNGNTWQQVGADIDGVAPADEFGGSIATSRDGSRIIVGAMKNDGLSGSQSDNRGHVRMFDWDGSNWVQTGTEILGTNAGDEFGSSVDMSASGDRIAVGATKNDAIGSESGHVRVFDWNGTSWIQVGQSIVGEATGDLSGYRIALSTNGDRIAISAQRNSGNGTWSGHVRLHQLFDTQWQQVGGDIDGEATDDRSGHGVSLSGDGTRVAVGSAINDAGTGTTTDNRGHVRIFGFLPAAPTITSVVEGGESLSVSFTPGGDNGIGVTNYKYSTDGNTYVALNPASTSSPFTITGLTAGTAYSITIKAVNPVGDSVASVAVNGTPQQTTTTTATPTTTTVATTSPEDTATARAEKVNSLPETGNDSSTMLLIGALVSAGGLLIVVRRRIVQ